MHPDRLFTLKNPRPVAHHTRLVKGRLTIQNKDVTIPEVPVHFLVDSGR